MTFLAADAFNNPDSPVYYIVGVVFLLLIFGALAAYLLISKHLEKKKSAAKSDADGQTEQTAAEEESKQSAVNADTAENESASMPEQSSDIEIGEKEKPDAEE